MLNQTDLARDVAVSAPTVHRWLSLLETSFQVVRVGAFAVTAGHGLAALKGHRSVGGCRASIYNAMPVEGVQLLRDFMLAGS